MSIRRSWSVLLSHPAVRYPNVKCRRRPCYPEQLHPDSPSGCEISAPSVYPDQLHLDSSRGHVGAPLSGLREGEAHNTREHHTRTIAYPIRICCPDTDHVPPPSCPDSLSEHILLLAFWIAYGKGLQSYSPSCFWTFYCFSMDSKELSSISDCFGDQKAIKTPKLNTIWLELIARVLNMLIGLKDDNYYSKVFKRVNYMLSNNTFWVVITSLP